MLRYHIEIYWGIRTTYLSAPDSIPPVVRPSAQYTSIWPRPLNRVHIVFAVGIGGAHLCCPLFLDDSPQALDVRPLPHHQLGMHFTL